MIKQNKTKLQFVLGAILFLSVAVAACNNDGEKKVVVKDEPAVTDSLKKNKTDSMVKETGGVSPTEENRPK